MAQTNTVSAAHRIVEADYTVKKLNLLSGSYV